MVVVCASPFKVDWHNLESVKAYARRLGSGHIVMKDPNRSNYNICHAERTELYGPEMVVFRT